MEAGTPEKRSWFLSSSYEYHDVSDLVSGTKDVPDETGRKRRAQTLILEGSYGINDQFSVSTLISAVEHTRKVGQNSTVKANGVGDGIVMLRYTPMKIGLLQKNGLAFGIGSISLSYLLAPILGATVAVFLYRWFASQK